MSEACRLTLTPAEADQLVRLVSIAELAVGEHYRTGWLPGGRGDAALMLRYLDAIKGAPSLERPMRELGAWVRTVSKTPES
jgi:hypothetical protein